MDKTTAPKRPGTVVVQNIFLGGGGGGGGGIGLTVHKMPKMPFSDQALLGLSFFPNYPTKSHIRK